MIMENETRVLVYYLELIFRRNKCVTIQNVNVKIVNVKIVIVRRIE